MNHINIIQPKKYSRKFNPFLPRWDRHEMLETRLRLDTGSVSHQYLLFKFIRLRLKNIEWLTQKNPLGRNRTSDHTIYSHALYQLSYKGLVLGERCICWQSANVDFPGLQKEKNCTPCRIRTCDHRLRRPTFYPAELTGLCWHPFIADVQNNLLRCTMQKHFGKKNMQNNCENIKPKTWWKYVRAQPDLNQRPVDLQSTALPLSYTPGYWWWVMNVWVEGFFCC